MNRRGVITLVFDDGYEHTLRDIVPLLEARDFSGVFAVPIDGRGVAKETGQRVAPWQEWLAVKGRGHEVAAHSISHADLTKLTGVDLAQELAAPADELGATTVVYPGGAHDATTVAAAGPYYTAGRGVQWGFESLPPRDPMRLRTINWSQRNWSLRKANLFALWAWLGGRWLIETFHVVSEESCEALHCVPRDEFIRHLDFVKRLPVNVKTIHDVLNTSENT